MKQDNINYLLVGSFVLLMFVLLLAALFRIAGQHSNTDPYYVVYDNVTGVQVGTAVTFGGYQIGQVQNIAPVRERDRTRFRLELAIRSGWQIPADSVARVVSVGLLTSNMIDIQEGADERFLRPGETIAGEEEVSMMTLLNSMAHEMKDLSEQSIKPLLENLNRKVEGIGGTLGQEIPKITAKTNALLDRLNQGAEGMNQLFNEENGRRVSSLLANADQASGQLVDISDQFAQLGTRLEQVLTNSNDILGGNKDDIRRSVVDLRAALDRIAQGVDTILYDLENASRNMNEFSRRIRDNPGSLLKSTPPTDPSVSSR